jgi:hypothetical protein
MAPNTVCPSRSYRDLYHDLINLSVIAPSDVDFELIHSLVRVTQSGLNWGLRGLMGVSEWSIDECRKGYSYIRVGDALQRLLKGSVRLRLRPGRRVEEVGVRMLKEENETHGRTYFLVFQCPYSYVVHHSRPEHSHEISWHEGKVPLESITIWETRKK